MRAHLAILLLLCLGCRTPTSGTVESNFGSVRAKDAAAHELYKQTRALLAPLVRNMQSPETDHPFRLGMRRIPLPPLTL